MGLGFGQGLQEGEQIVGVGAGQVEAEVDRSEARGQGFQAFPELLVAGRGLSEIEVGDGRLQVGAQGGSMVRRQGKTMAVGNRVEMIQAIGADRAEPRARRSPVLSTLIVGPPA